MRLPYPPPRVADVTVYFDRAPDAPSERLVYWQQRIAGGWRPNKRINKMGYHESAEFFGVYIWEYIHVLAPLLRAR